MHNNTSQEVIPEIRAFNRYYTIVIGLLDEHLLHSGFSLTEVRLMYEVSRQTSLTARELKEQLQIDEGYLSRLVNSLVTRGLLEKAPSAQDKRTKHLRLTATGTDVFSGISEKQSAAVAALIGHLDEEQQQALVAHMASIQRLLQSSPAFSQYQT